LLDAEGYFRQALEIDPKDGSHTELGALYVQMGRYDDAKTELTKALGLNKNDARAYIEMGNLLLLRESNQEAVRECRRAVSVDKNNDEAHRALAIALMSAGQYDEAEKALRKAINHIGGSKQWQLHLMLSQVLIRLGDDSNKDRDLYSEALKHVKKAGQTNPSPNADVFFHEGIVQYKLEDYRSARKSFQNCLKANRDRFEAERYGKLVTSLIRQERRISKINTWGGLVMATLCVLMLLLLWGCYFANWKITVPASAPAASDSNTKPTEKTETARQTEATEEPHEEMKVDKSMLTLMTPLLLGLLVVALLLPNLNKLKLPGGFEAEISELKTKENISSGPKGDIGFGSSLPIISPGPR
jgi:tetratricopeptide (TPR) repeat protein